MEIVPVCKVCGDVIYFFLIEVLFPSHDPLLELRRTRIVYRSTPQTSQSRHVSLHVTSEALYLLV